MSSADRRMRALRPDHAEDLGSIFVGCHAADRQGRSNHEVRAANCHQRASYRRAGARIDAGEQSPLTAGVGTAATTERRAEFTHRVEFQLSQVAARQARRRSVDGNLEKLRASSISRKTCVAPIAKPPNETRLTRPWKANALATTK